MFHKIDLFVENQCSLGTPQHMSIPVSNINNLGKWWNVRANTSMTELNYLRVALFHLWTF